MIILRGRKMTYKLIALDLDGTLKSTDKQILPKTKAILQELAKRGVVIVLASGRPTAGLYAEAMHPFSYCITFHLFSSPF